LSAYRPSLKLPIFSHPSFFLVALVEHRHLDRGIGETPSGITLRHPITALPLCEPLCATAYNGQNAVLDVRIRRSTSIHGSEFRSSHDLPFTRQPVMLAEAAEPIEHARLTMMLTLAQAHKVGVLLLVVCSISIICPVKIPCPV
jgi:hypothetical protein